MSLKTHHPVPLPLAAYKAQHVKLTVEGKLGDADAESAGAEKSADLRKLCRDCRHLPCAAAHDDQVKAFVITGEGGNFCSGGDVFEIIGPLIEMNTGRSAEIHQDDRRSGEGDARSRRRRSLRRSMAFALVPVRSWRCSSDLRIGTAQGQRSLFLFNRVGLAGCDMGACSILPRIIGQGRAAELLYTGRVMSGEEAERWGFFNRVVVVRKRAGRCDCARQWNIATVRPLPTA